MVNEKAAKLFIITVSGLLLYFGLKYAAPALLPFLIAYLVAGLAGMPAEYLSRKTKADRRFFSVLLILLTLACIALLLFALVSRLVFEVKEFAVDFLSDGTRLPELLKSADEIGDRVAEWLKLDGEVFDAIAERVNLFVETVTESLIGRAGTILERFAAGVAGAVPDILLFLTVTVLATLYMACSRRWKDAVRALVPDRFRKGMTALNTGVLQTVARYCRAYLLLMVITFALIFAGLCILRVKYAFFLALLIAFVDLLPVLGVGTVLIPWALGALIAGHSARGIGLLVLYAISCVVHSAAESRIIGRSFGIHPVLTLTAVYAGYRLLGFIGILAFPLGLVALQALTSAEKTVPDTEDDRDGPLANRRGHHRRNQ